MRSVWRDTEYDNEEMLEIAIEDQLWTTVTFTTLPLTPEPPQLFSQTESTINLTWNAAENAKRYDVRYHRLYIPELIFTRRTKSTHLVLTGLSAGESYLISIRTLSTAGVTSEWSPPTEAKTNDRTVTQLQKLKNDLGIPDLTSQLKFKDGFSYYEFSLIK